MNSDGIETDHAGDGHIRLERYLRAYLIDIKLFDESVVGDRFQCLDEKYLMSMG